MSEPRLRIAQVAPLWAAVPPSGYGGAELMVHWLTEALVARGHDVTLYASGDSRSAGRLEAICETNVIDAMGAGQAADYLPYAISSLAQALTDAPQYDVIHSHIGTPGFALGDLSSRPVLHTVHAGLDGVDEQWLLRRHPEALIATISDSQAAVATLERRRNMRTIYHGCDFSDYELGASHEGYLAFIGRMGPNKNPAGAIRIAREVGMPIRLAGQPQDRKESAYFESEVRPLLDGRNAEYLGPVSQADKVRLLKGAAALLFPIHWDEHFGIAMIEAMACGAPVVANRRGSVPEVVDSGVTGYIGDGDDALIALTRDALELDRRGVRAHAEERFSHTRMADNYLALYRKMLRGDP
jgi:glycosyltransferase involved in cell wall biosynthesis